MTVGELKLALKGIPDYMMVEVMDSSSCGYVAADEMIRIVAELHIEPTEE
jgi:hypothetical protein